MDINDMTRKQFKELKQLDWDEKVKVDSIVLLPTKFHDSSGYNLFNIIACHHNKPLGKIGLYDTHSIIMESKWNRVGIDCLRNSSFMRIFLPDEYKIIPYLHQTIRDKGE